MGNRGGEPCAGFDYVRLEASGIQPGVPARRQRGSADIDFLVVLPRPLRALPRAVKDRVLGLLAQRAHWVDIESDFSKLLESHYAICERSF